MIQLPDSAAQTAPRFDWREALQWETILKIAIVNGTVIDATGAPPKLGYTVLIEGSTNPAATVSYSFAVKLIGPASSNWPKVSWRGWPPSAETAKTWR